MGNCLTGSCPYFARKLPLAIFPEITHGLTTKKYGFYLTQADDGISGSHTERGAYQQLMADIGRGAVQCIVVKDLSRIGRDMIDYEFRTCN